MDKAKGDLHNAAGDVKNAARNLANPIILAMPTKMIITRSKMAPVALGLSILWDTSTNSMISKISINNDLSFSLIINELYVMDFV